MPPGEQCDISMHHYPGSYIEFNNVVSNVIFSVISIMSSVQTRFIAVGPNGQVYHGLNKK